MKVSLLEEDGKISKQIFFPLLLDFQEKTEIILMDLKINYKMEFYYKILERFGILDCLPNSRLEELNIFDDAFGFFLIVTC